MASKKSTNISLLILGVASALTIAYLIWLYLAPPATVPLVEQALPTDFNTDVVGSSGFHVLQPFASLPVPVGAVGRPNPFSDFEPAAKAPLGNANANTNANANVNTNAAPAAPIPPIPPLVNSPENFNLNGNPL
jgi:hypothetical protein